jgi:hypothetical protein
MAVVVLTAAAVNVLWDANDSSRYADPTAIAVALAILATGSLVLAPRWPMAVAIIAVCAVGGLTIGEYSRWVAALGPCIAIPWVARAGSVARWLVVAGVVLVVTGVALCQEPYISDYVAATLLYVVPCVVAAGAIEMTQARRAQGES